MNQTHSQSNGNYIKMILLSLIVNDLIFVFSNEWTQS